MAAVLEGHTQAVSRISRDDTSTDEAIYLSLSLLDIMCPRRWKRDREATGDMQRWIHELTGAGQWDFTNLMKFEVITMHGQPLQQNGQLEQHGEKTHPSIVQWKPSYTYCSSNIL